MAKYIELDAVLAEIEKRIRACGNCYILDELTSLHRTFESLEVKEVDLEKEIDRELETRWRGEYLFTSKFRESAKHFFELGLKTQKGDCYE